MNFLSIVQRAERSAEASDWMEFIGYVSDFFRDISFLFCSEIKRAVVFITVQSF